VQTAERQARRRGGGLALELKVLALHGFLHLLGYDHEIDDGEMRRVEYRLRRRFGITRPRGSRRHECRTPSRNPGERRRPL
jgi:probable rRNA maturation factor